MNIRAQETPDKQHQIQPEHTGLPHLSRRLVPRRGVGFRLDEEEDHRVANPETT